MHGVRTWVAPLSPTHCQHSRGWWESDCSAPSDTYCYWSRGQGAATAVNEMLHIFVYISRPCTSCGLLTLNVCGLSTSTGGFSVTDKFTGSPFTIHLTRCITFSMLISWSIASSNVQVLYVLDIHVCAHTFECDEKQWFHNLHGCSSPRQTLVEYGLQVCNEPEFSTLCPLNNYIGRPAVQPSWCLSDLPFTSPHATRQGNRSSSALLAYVWTGEW